MKTLLSATLAGMVAAGLTSSACATENWTGHDLPYRAWTGPELLQRWMFLNEQCRGGAGDDPATTRACDERNLVDAALFAHGYCYVGNYGAEQGWERGPASRWTRRGEHAVCHGWGGAQ